MQTQDSFNLNSADDWNSMVGQNSFGRQLGNTSATLYLIQKRYIPDQVRRPLLYNFNGEFRRDLDRSINAPENVIRTNLTDMMLDDSSARSAILPSRAGHNIDLHRFSDYWTFVLVVDSDSAPDLIGLVRPTPHRELYSGWIMDEPVHAQVQGSINSTSINPNAILSITHDVSLAANSVQSPSGMVTSVDTLEDNDYVDSSTLQSIQQDGQQLFKITPKALVSSIVPDTVGYTDTFTIAPAPMQISTDTIAISTDDNNPTQHLSNVVSAISGAVASQKQDIGGTDYYGGADTMLANMQRYIPATSVSKNHVAIDPRVPTTIGELDRKFNGGLNVIVVNQPWESCIDLGNPQINSERNMCIKIFEMALPNLLATCGIADIACMYDSTQGNDFGHSGMLTKGRFNLQTLGMLYECSPMQKDAAYSRLQRLLRTNIFSIILDTCGEFFVCIQASIAGTTHVDLMLYDYMRDPTQGNGMIETNNLLGGLNSPQIGTQAEATHNATQLYGALKDFSDASMYGGLPDYPVNNSFFPGV